jgi:putative transcriptional regulator
VAIQITLRDVLERLGISQTELQLRTGLAYSTVNDLYHGRVRRIELATLNVLCEALSCDVADLLAYKSERPGR